MKSLTLFSSSSIDIEQELEQEYQRYRIDGSPLYDDGLKDVILFVKFNQETKKLSETGLTDSERLSYLRRLLEMRMDNAMIRFEKKIILNFSPDPEKVIAELKNEIQMLKTEKKFSPIRQQLFFIKLGLLTLGEKEKRNDQPEWNRVYELILNTTLVQDDSVIVEHIQDFLNVYSVFQATMDDETEYDDEFVIEGLMDSDCLESPFYEKFKLDFAGQIIPFYNHAGNLGLNSALYAMAHHFYCVVLGDEPREAHLNLFGTGCSPLNMLLHDNSHAASLKLIENFTAFYEQLINKIKTEGLLIEYKKDLFFIFSLIHDLEFDINEYNCSFETTVVQTIKNMLYAGNVEEADLIDFVEPLNELGYNISGSHVNEIREAFFDLADGFISRHAMHFSSNNQLTFK